MRVLVIEAARSRQPHVRAPVENLEAGYFSRALIQAGAEVTLVGTDETFPDPAGFDCLAVSVEHVTAEAAAGLVTQHQAAAGPAVVAFGSWAPAICAAWDPVPAVVPGWDRLAARPLIESTGSAAAGAADVRDGMVDLGPALRRTIPAEFESGRLWSLRASSGCGRRCGFCSVGAQYPLGWQGRSPAAVRDELVDLGSRFGARDFWFGDESFVGGATPARERQLESALEEAGARIPGFAFAVNMRCSDVSPARIARLRSLGLGRALLGIESLDGSTLRRMGKGIEPREAARAIRVLEAAGVEAVPSFVWPDPWSTAREMRSHLDSLAETGLARFFSVTPWVPLPGSPWFERAGNSGYRVGDPADAWTASWPSAAARDFMAQWSRYLERAERGFPGLRGRLRAGWTTATQLEGLGPSDARRARRDAAAALSRAEHAVAAAILAGGDWATAVDRSLEEIARDRSDELEIMAVDEQRARGCGSTGSDRRSGPSRWRRAAW